MEIDQKRIELD